MGTTSVNPTGVVLPAGLLATLEAEGAAAQAAAAQSPAVSNPGLPGGVAAMPVDAQTWLQFVLAEWPLVYNNPTSVSCVLNARILNPNGTITNNQYSITFSATGGQNQRFSMPPGYLLGVTLTCTTANVPSGAYFCLVGLVHQNAANQTFDVLLICDYLTSLNPLAWPCGILHAMGDGPGAPFAFQGTNPPAGSAYTVTLDEALFQLQNVTVSFTTSATAANRSVFVYASPPPGTLVITIAVSPALQVASTTLEYTFMMGGPTVTIVPGNEYGPIAGPIRLPYGTIVGISALQLQAGDQLSAIYLIGTLWS